MSHWNLTDIAAGRLCGHKSNMHMMQGIYRMVIFIPDRWVDLVETICHYFQEAMPLYNATYVVQLISAWSIKILIALLRPVCNPYWYRTYLDMNIGNGTSSNLNMQTSAWFFLIKSIQYRAIGYIFQHGCNHLYKDATHTYAKLFIYSHIFTTRSKDYNHWDA